MARVAYNLIIKEKSGKQFATFDVISGKASVDKVACLVEGKWLDIDKGNDWTESIVAAITDDELGAHNKEAIAGLRELFDAP